MPNLVKHLMDCNLMTLSIQKAMTYLNQLTGEIIEDRKRKNVVNSFSELFFNHFFLSNSFN
jgi:hypothetical protein